MARRFFLYNPVRIRATPGTLERIGRAAYASTALVQHVSVYHCRVQVTVSQQLLNRPDVVAILQPLSRERMTEDMRRGRLGDSRFKNGPLHRRLHYSLVKMQQREVMLNIRKRFR